MNRHLRQSVAWLLLTILPGIQLGCAGKAVVQPATGVGEPLPTPEVREVASFVFAAIHGGTVEGAALYGAEFVTGWILNMLISGGEKPDDATTAALKNMQSQLTQLQGQMTQLQADLTKLYLQARTNTDEIKAAVAKVDVANELTTIDAWMALLKSQQVNPDAFAAQILNTGTGVPFLLKKIQDKVVGFGDDGVLDLVADYLVSKTNGSADPAARLNAYLAFEYYFGHLLAVQAQGLTLVSEAYHEVKANPGSPAAAFLPPGKDPIQALKDYMGGLYAEQIEAQVQKFLSCTERIVARTADTTALKSSFLPDAATILKRADFVRATWEAQRGASGGRLVLRVVGEPQRVASYAGTWASGALQFQVLPGWAHGPGTQPPANLRAYPVSPSYAQWPPLAGQGHFSEADNVAGASFVSPAVAPGPVTVTTPYDGSVTDAIAYFDDKMNKVDGATYPVTVTKADGSTKVRTKNAILFGSVLVPCRKDPFVATGWGGANDWIDVGSLHKTSDYTKDMASGVFQASAQAGPEPKWIQSTLPGYAWGSDKNFHISLKGHLYPDPPFVFDGPAARDVKIGFLVDFLCTETDPKGVAMHSWSPTQYIHWVGTANTSEQQVLNTQNAGTELLSIQKRLSPGGTLSPQPGYYAYVWIRPRTFHSDAYTLDMKLTLKGLWIQFL